MKQGTVSKTDKKINTRGTLGRLFRFMKPYRIRIILMVACLVMGAVFTKMCIRDSISPSAM